MFRLVSDKYNSIIKNISIKMTQNLLCLSTYFYMQIFEAYLCLVSIQTSNNSLSCTSYMQFHHSIRSIDNLLFIYLGNCCSNDFTAAITLLGKTYFSNWHDYSEFSLCNIFQMGLWPSESWCFSVCFICRLITHAKSGQQNIDGLEKCSCLYILFIAGTQPSVSLAKYGSDND